jgi:hypothetical protein
MIKVRVVRGMRTALPFASGLVALSGAVTACATPASEDVGADDSTLTVVDPGTGVFELGWAYGTPTGYAFTAKGSRDEYVRALQKMTFSIPAWFLWSQLHPSHSTPDAERLKELSAKVTITFYRDGGSYRETTVTTNGWEGGDHVYGVRATTSQFVVDRRAQSMRFSIEITDHGTSPPMTKVLDDGSFFEQPVIGGTLPQKTLLFDTVGSSLRSRVLEGGQPVQDADLSIAYTDWRAATLVDASMIDRQIGTATSYGRFGAFELPIYGDLEYEVSYGVAVDGVWQDEQPLVANAHSRLLPQNRTAYEGRIFVPQGAQSLQLYFHVKAFLKVDYSKHQNVRSRRYAEGARLLVSERWDNENGATHDNYDFATEAR